MNLQSMFNNAGRAAKNNAPAILTGVSIAGVITTAYLTARAAYKAAQVIEAQEATEGVIVDPKERLKKNVKATWPLYIAPAVAGTVTVGCIVASSKASANRTAAAMAAYTLTEKAFGEYKEKVIELHNANKEEKIRAAIAQDRVSSHPVPPALLEKTAVDRQRVLAGEDSKEIVVLGRKQVRCFEGYTGRYLLSDMEALKHAENEINAYIIQHNYSSLSQFYSLIDVRPTQSSDDIGWNFDKMLKLEFHTVLSEDDEPCLAFDYKYIPFPL